MAKWERRAELGNWECSRSEGLSEQRLKDVGTELQIGNRGSSRASSWCKGPEVRMCLECSEAWRYPGLCPAMLLWVGRSLCSPHPPDCES